MKQNETLSSITRRTRQKYAAELARYVVYTVRMVRAGRFSVESVKSATEEYVSAAQGVSWTVRCTALQRLLEAVLLQRQHMCAPTRNIHVRLFVACVSVLCKFDKDGEVLERARFADPWEVSHSLASLQFSACLLYTSPSPRDLSTSRMPSSA